MIARAFQTERTDQELMVLLAEGDMAPLGELYMRYGGVVRSLLFRLLQGDSVAEADDLLHEVFETVYKTASRFQPNREVRPWLFGITVRKARGWQRKMWARQHLLKRYVKDKEATVSSVVESPDARTAARHQIDRALLSLPKGQREVLILHVTEDLSGEQIADALDLRLGTVWTRLRRARLAMRAALGHDVGKELGVGQ